MVNFSTSYVKYYDTYDMGSGCSLNSSIICDDISKCKFFINKTADDIQWTCNRLICSYDNLFPCSQESFIYAILIIGIPCVIGFIIAVIYISVAPCLKMCSEVDLAMKYDEENPKQI